MIFIDKKSKTPYYLQIYSKLQADILNKKLKSGDVLKGSRMLSKEIGVGRNTVDNAYSQLAAEGYIESKKGVGFIVQDINEVNLSITNTVSNQSFKHGSKNLKDNSILYNLSYGDFTDDLFPAIQWKKYMSDALSEKNMCKINKCIDGKGDILLRKQLVSYLNNSRGVCCNEDQIIITSGLQHSLEIICKLIFSDGGTIGFEEPGYDGAKVVFKNNNLKIEALEVDDKGLKVSELENQKNPNLNAIYITPSHQFPTGATMPINRRYELLNWSYINNTYIIEDDYDSEFGYNTNPIPSLQSIDKNDKVIYLGTFSKTLSPSIRIGYFVLPIHLLNIYNQTFDKYNNSVSWVDQYILSKFIETGFYERHVRKLRLKFKKRFDLFINEITNMNSEIKIHQNGTGLYFILEFPKKYSQDWLIKKALDEKIIVYPTIQYWQNKEHCPKNTLFIAFSQIDILDIPDCISRLNNAWFSDL
jgi:GntR family transcriptional regulator/MocR family aminotransferase